MMHLGFVNFGREHWGSLGCVPNKQFSLIVCTYVSKQCKYVSKKRKKLLEIGQIFSNAGKCAPNAGNFKPNSEKINLVKSASIMQLPNFQTLLSLLSESINAIVSIPQSNWITETDPGSWVWSRIWSGMIQLSLGRTSRHRQSRILSHGVLCTGVVRLLSAIRSDQSNWSRISWVNWIKPVLHFDPVWNASHCTKLSFFRVTPSEDFLITGFTQVLPGVRNLGPIWLRYCTCGGSTSHVQECGQARPGPTQSSLVEPVVFC